MQENVNYDELMIALIELNHAIHMGREAVRNDCGSVSIKLNEVGFQGLATTAIDSSFSSMNNYFRQAHNYVAELVNWVNTNVIREYQTTDEWIKQSFQEALDGVLPIQSFGGYGTKNYIGGDGPYDNSATTEWMSKMSEYGN